MLLRHCVLTGMVFGGSRCVIPHPLTITCVRNSSNSFMSIFFFFFFFFFFETVQRFLSWSEYVHFDWDITFFTAQVLLKCIGSGHLVSNFISFMPFFFWNCASVVFMVWRCAYDLDIILGTNFSSFWTYYFFSTLQLTRAKGFWGVRG